MPVGTPHPRRTLVVLCLASAAWAFSFGLGAPLAALWMHDAGWGGRVVGLNTCVYYLGAAAGALAAPALMRRAGRWCVTGGIVADALTTALFPWASGVAGWFLLRLLSGVAGGLCLIPMETLVNRNAPAGRRARDFGAYAVCVALGIGLGTLAGLPLYPWSPRLAFALGGLAALPAALLTHWGLPRRIEEMEGAGGTARPALGRNRLSLAAAWAQGFLEGGMVTFLPLHLLALGYTEAQVSGLLAVLFLGVVLFQNPSAHLADRVGRLRVLLAFHCVLLLGLFCLPFCTGPLAVGAWLFVVGGCCAAIYPLGLALLGERTPPPALARANAWYLASNCVGSLSGPVLMGTVIDLTGAQPAFFGVGLAAVGLVLIVWLAGLGRSGEGDTAADQTEGEEPARRLAG